MVSQILKYNIWNKSTDEFKIWIEFINTFLRRKKKQNKNIPGFVKVFASVRHSAGRPKTLS